MEPEPGPWMCGKVCLVTGATAGIGRVTARELAGRGARVLGVGRSPERCAEAAREIRQQAGTDAVEFLVADLSSQREIRRLARAVNDRTDRLHILVNNAGGIFLEHRESPDGIELTFALNHLAYFLLTTLLLDLLKADATARIVNVSSAAHQGARLDLEQVASPARYRAWRAYCDSKLANLLFTRELARRLDGTGVTANALHPGYVRTGIFKVDGVRGWLLRRAVDLFAIPPEVGAKTSIYLATSPEVSQATGQYFVRSKPATMSAAARDDDLALRLWDLSQRLTSASAGNST